MNGAGERRRIAIVGGGLAGAAAAVALAERGLHVELFEARRKLGGRAASFADAATEELIDHCQHVGMACCTNFIDFCRRTGIDRFFRRDATLYFFSPDGRRYELSATSLLPAPLHLLPSLLRLGYLTLAERLGICRAMVRLARAATDDDRATFGEWLAEQRQTPNAIERFWAPVVVSALGETVERASLKYARKVFVDGFMANRRGYEVDMPLLPLGELYGERLADALQAKGVFLRTGVTVQTIDVVGNRPALEIGDGERWSFDAVVCAVPWRRAAELFSTSIRNRLPNCERWATLAAAPISGVHLWFDRPITSLPHAVLVGTLGQWLFNPTGKGGDGMGNGEWGMGNQETGEASASARPSPLTPHPSYYYQIVISASRDLAGRSKEAIVDELTNELRRIFPEAREALLLRSKLVTEREAVFSVAPGIDSVRPPQTTAVDGLFLAGDWTATGWPATMEGAVRSGYLAAEGVLRQFGRAEPVVFEDLPRTWFAKRVLRSKNEVRSSE